MDVQDHRWGSASLDAPTMWWYSARSRLLAVLLGRFVPPDGLVLDVGSADGPSVGWLARRARVVPVDIDPRGLTVGGVRADALSLPFGDGTFDAVSAFDVVEHFTDDHALMSELTRVARPGGVVLVSVPAYQWAWSDFDVQSGHYRRYTAASLQALGEAHGCEVLRISYLFAATFPAFVVARWLLPRMGGTPDGSGRLPSWLDRLLQRLSRLDEHVLRRGSLPFGSSVAAVMEVRREVR